MARIAIYRKERFNAAHRLFRKDWTDEKNLGVFGKCAYPNFHGHNYDLVVKIVGEQNPETGFVMDLKHLSTIIKENVLDRFDHKNLNEDCIEFKELNPTAENIAVVIFNILRPLINSSFDLQIRLYETERNFVEYPA